MPTKRTRLARLATLTALTACTLALPAHATPNLARGAVYAMTDAPDGNAVVVYQRTVNGHLAASGTYPTGGAGNGTGVDPLRSQGGLVLDRGLLFAVNAGSNDLSVFAVGKRVLTLVQRIATGGTMPTSVTVHGDLLYVLNAGSSAIAGFRIGEQGQLAPIAGSTRALVGGSAASPSQLSFTPAGDGLVVTERGTAMIDVFPVGDDGVAGEPQAFASNGAAPFGFAFDRRGTLVVSEAAGAAASSYRLADSGAQVVSGSVGTGEKATCWLAIVGRNVFVANAGTATISRFVVGNDGALSLADAEAAVITGGGAPLDMAVAGGGEYLYVSLEKTGEVAGYRVEDDGTLTALGSVSGLPIYFQGIAAQ
jgi:6-phosphogluconolactonase (cycloisomerase 2 family)